MKMSVSPDTHSVPNIKSQITPTVDSEREEFRKYFEASGLLDFVTKIFKQMYDTKDKSTDPLTYFTNTVGAINYESREIISLEDEVSRLTEVIENLQKENSFLRSELDKALSS